MSEEAQDYARGLLAEEAGEIVQALGKAARFGIDTPGPDSAPYFSATAREMIELECGDMLAAIEWAIYAGLIRCRVVDEQRARKLRRLLSPESRDNLGRRLAPEVINSDSGRHRDGENSRSEVEGEACQSGGETASPIPCSPSTGGGS